MVTKNTQKGFDWKYWLQNSLLGVIITIGGMCLHEIQRQREFRVGAELKLQAHYEQITNLNVGVGLANKRSENNSNDLATLWALVPQTIKFKRSYER